MPKKTKETKKKKVILKPKLSKPKKIIKVPEGRGIIHGGFSSNNTIFRLTKENGDALGKTISGGVLGYENTKKGLVHVAEKAAQAVVELAGDYGVNVVSLQVKGTSVGRNPAIEKILEASSLKIEWIGDKTPVKHGGCRPPKKPRK